MSRFSIYLLSPPALLSAAWIMTVVGVLIGFAFHDSLPVLSRAMRNYGIDFDYPVIGVIWISVCMGLFLLFSIPLLRRPPAEGPSPGSSRRLTNAVIVAALMFGFYAAIILGWVFLTAARVGGVGALFAMAQSFEVDAARDLLLSNSFFTGMRLFYAGFYCFGVFGACVVAHNLRTGDKDRFLMIAGALMFLASVGLLGWLSIILSQRLLAIQTIIGGFIAASMLYGRIYGVKYIPVFIFVMFAIWSAREAVTVGRWDPDANPAMVGFERLLFYFINDFGNSVWPFRSEIPNTYGLFTFRFIIYFTLQDEFFSSLLRDQLIALSSVRGGGEFPIFTGPFIDFSYFGILVVIFIAVLFTYVYNRSHNDFFYAWLYGMIGASLLISTHVPYYSSHNFFFNIMTAFIVSLFIPRRI